MLFNTDNVYATDNKNIHKHTASLRSRSNSPSNNRSRSRSSSSSSRSSSSSSSHETSHSSDDDSKCERGQGDRFEAAQLARPTKRKYILYEMKRTGLSEVATYTAASPQGAVKKFCTQKMRKKFDKGKRQAAPEGKVFWSGRIYVGRDEGSTFTNPKLYYCTIKKKTTRRFINGREITMLIETIVETSAPGNKSKRSAKKRKSIKRRKINV